MNTIKKIIGWICLSPVILAACVMCLFTAPFGLFLGFPIALLSELAEMRKGVKPNIKQAVDFSLDFAFYPLKFVMES